MGRKSLKEARQKEIIKEFYKLAKKEGIENTSIAKIAKKMDINPSLIIHYFQTREDLVYGLIEYILDKYQLIYKVSTKKPLDSRAALLEIMDNIFSKKWNTLFDDGLFYSCYSLTFRESKARNMYKKLLDSLREALGNHIRQCREEGVLLADNVEAVADNIFILVDGAYFYLSLVSDKNEYEEKLRKYKEQAIELLCLSEVRTLSV
ncbi:TetR family transcriptional regulator [Dyadobacter chenwenxiniae]|uniref:Biofilm operon icaADBC HTH-type negative transcriptional regulator IcaR n=1 Tax=Dyadobacter chenwenxiniae TaxID=2906456 RepID=A0A9X1PRQ0_9BACT|nr:TetR family transcriptional regulator [Dyadobacter chenwenxiniae]MCF0063816.1 TetR family transcriptional regulator [Dyadobacter chenwenxiniae]UON83492.1 TetR family transcriptional regulator [Dyadobacter chenwenxiniae]